MPDHGDEKDDTNLDEDDALLLALALRAEERAQKIDPRFEKMLLGGAEAERELAAAAQSSDSSPSSEQARALFQIHRPFNETEMRALTARIAATRSARERAKERAGRRHRPRWATRFRLVCSAAITAAVVAGLMHFMRAPAPLPVYALELSGGQRAERSVTEEEAGPRRVRAGGELELILRPERPDRAGIDIQADVRGDGRERALRERWEISENGAARSRLAVDRLFGDFDGELTLTVTVRRGEESRVLSMRVVRVRARE